MFKNVLFFLFLFCHVSFAQKAKVYVWLSADCPLSQKYTLTLRQLSQLHTPDSIIFMAVFPSNTKKEIKTFIKKYKLTVDFQQDIDKRLTQKFSATITPEVVLVDANEKVFYQGAIDNQAIALGKFLPEATEKYLQNAIQELLSGQICTIPKTTPIGCFIE